MYQAISAMETAKHGSLTKTLNFNVFFLIFGTLEVNKKEIPLNK